MQSASFFRKPVQVDVRPEFVHYLVTGGAGFIGSHLVDALLEQGHRVTVLDDLSTGSLANLDHHRADPRLEFVQGSILDQPLVARLVSDADAIYHLAAVVGVKHVVDDPLRGMVVNVQGTEIILEEAARCGRKVLVASSSETYGKSVQVPLQEDADTLFGSSTVPRWSYALSKLLDEQLALAYHRQKGLPVVAVRYFNAYGPRLDPRGYGSVVARFISQARRGEPLTIYGDGEQTRTFTYVSDTVAGTMAAMTTPSAVGMVFNIGNNVECSIEVLANKIRGIVNPALAVTYIPYQAAYGAAFEETRRRLPDTARAREILGFQATVPLDEGLRRTIHWFEECFYELIEA